MNLWKPSSRKAKAKVVRAAPSAAAAAAAAVAAAAAAVEPLEGGDEGRAKDAADALPDVVAGLTLLQQQSHEDRSAVAGALDDVVQNPPRGGPLDYRAAAAAAAMLGHATAPRESLPYAEIPEGRSRRRTTRPPPPHAAPLGLGAAPQGPPYAPPGGPGGTWRNDGGGTSAGLWSPQGPEGLGAGGAGPSSSSSSSGAAGGGGSNVREAVGLGAGGPGGPAGACGGEPEGARIRSMSSEPRGGSRNDERKTRCSSATRSRNHATAAAAAGAQRHRQQQQNDRQSKPQQQQQQQQQQTVPCSHPAPTSSPPPVQVSSSSSGTSLQAGAMAPLSTTTGCLTPRVGVGTFEGVESVRGTTSCDTVASSASAGAGGASGGPGVAHGYRVTDLEALLTQASPSRPANLPMVLASPTRLHNMRHSNSQSSSSSSSGHAPPMRPFLPLGVIVNAVFKTRDWLYVRTAHGAEGYVPYRVCLPLGILPPSRAPAGGGAEDPPAEGTTVGPWESRGDVFQPTPYVPPPARPAVGSHGGGAGRSGGGGVDGIGGPGPPGPHMGGTLPGNHPSSLGGTPLGGSSLSGAGLGGSGLGGAGLGAVAPMTGPNVGGGGGGGGGGLGVGPHGGTGLGVAGGLGLGGGGAVGLGGLGGGAVGGGTIPGAGPGATGARNPSTMGSSTQAADGTVPQNRGRTRGRRRAPGPRINQTDTQKLQPTTSSSASTSASARSASESRSVAREPRQPQLPTSHVLV